MSFVPTCFEYMFADIIFMSLALSKVGLPNTKLIYSIDRTLTCCYSVEIKSMFNVNLTLCLQDVCITTQPCKPFIV